MGVRRPGEESARVVVVDDETHVADLYAEYLGEDHEVEVAYGGEDALEVVDESVDVVLLDRRMPRLSGGEVLEEIRDRGYDCRVVMVTAVEPDFDVVEMGFDDYVTKPVDREVVVDLVREQKLLDRYDARLNEYVRKRKKVELLEDRKSRAELEDSDRYNALRVVTESIREEIEGLLEEYDLDPERTPEALDPVVDGAGAEDDDDGDGDDDGGVDWERIDGG